MEQQGALYLTLIDVFICTLAATCQILASITTIWAVSVARASYSDLILNTI